MLAFPASDLKNLLGRLIQVHVIEFQSLVVTDLNTERVLNVADGFCSFDNVRRIVRGPHAAHLLRIRVLAMRSAMLRINRVKYAADAGEAVLHANAKTSDERLLARG